MQDERKLNLKLTNFIAAEAVFLKPLEDTPAFFEEFVDSSKLVPCPAIIISFGGAIGPIDELTISQKDARELVMDVLTCLESLGDERAKEVCEYYFRKPVE